MISMETVEKMRNQAFFGVFQIYVKRLSRKSIAEFEAQGFKVSIPKANDHSQYQKVSWQHAKVKSGNINSLDENDAKYSLAQKLWIISKKSQNLTYEQQLKLAAKKGD